MLGSRPGRMRTTFMAAVQLMHNSCGGDKSEGKTDFSIGKNSNKTRYRFVMFRISIGFCLNLTFATNKPITLLFSVRRCNTSQHSRQVKIWNPLAVVCGEILCVNTFQPLPQAAQGTVSPMPNDLRAPS